MGKLEKPTIVAKIIANNRINLPKEPGIYSFWWMGPKTELLTANRHIMLKGPGGKWVDVEFEDWWPKNLVYPCLYVGKTTNIKNRFSWHIKNGSPERLHEIPANNKKQKPVTTSCQLRYGIEHVFKDEKKPLEIIRNKVGFSYDIGADSKEKTIVHRFFTEDKLIGDWRPWFNIDSER
jgi:hypothetical protein